MITIGNGERRDRGDFVRSTSTLNFILIQSKAISILWNGKGGIQGVCKVHASLSKLLLENFLTNSRNFNARSRSIRFLSTTEGSCLFLNR